MSTSRGRWAAVPPSMLTPSASATACASMSPSVTAARRTNTAPSRNRSATARAASMPSAVFPAPPGPASVTSRAGASSSRVRRELGGAADEGGGPQRQVPRGPAHLPLGAPTAARGAAGAGVMAGSWRRICSITARRSRDGSMPSSSARTRRVRANTSSASACRPALNRAVISWPTSRSRVGASATTGSQVRGDLLVPAQGEHPLGALSDRGQPQLGQPGRLDYGPGLAGEVRQTAPRATGPAPGRRRRPRALRSPQPRALSIRRGEPVHVHIARVGVEPVAGSVAVHQVRRAQPAERPAQLRHPQLQCVGRVVREVTGIPQCVDRAS